MTLSKDFDLIKSHQKKAPVEVLDITDDLGLQVLSAPNWSDDLSGMIKKEENGEYNIYVNGKHASTRQRFTIAHEIAHFVMHTELIGDGVVDDALYRSGLGSEVEAQANRLAAEILMPWHLLGKEINGGNSDIKSLAKKFSVSPSAMSIRLGVPYESR